MALFESGGRDKRSIAIGVLPRPHLIPVPPAAARRRTCEAMNPASPSSLGDEMFYSLLRYKPWSFQFRIPSPSPGEIQSCDQLQQSKFVSQSQTPMQSIVVITPHPIADNYRIQKSSDALQHEEAPHSLKKMPQIRSSPPPSSFTSRPNSTLLKPKIAIKNSADSLKSS